MKRIALVIAVPGLGVGVEAVRGTVEPMLTQLKFEVRSCDGKNATLDGIRAALDDLERDVGPGDSALVLYHGHGGRVHFCGLKPQPPGEEFSYLSVYRTPGRDFEGLLDIELSQRLRQLAERCSNVTVVLDCCHAGEAVRHVARVEEPLDHVTARTLTHSAWVDEVIAHVRQLEGTSERSEDRLANVVCVSASTPHSSAFAVEGVGLLTQELVNCVTEPEFCRPDATWDTLIHPLRERVITRVSNTEQWVTVAGPSARRLFSETTIEHPGFVGFLPGETDKVGLLRAGWLQGVRAGDVWELMGFDGQPVKGDDGAVITLEVAEGSVGLDCAAVKLSQEFDNADARPAYIRRIREPMMVSAPAELAPAVESSAWLALGDGEADLVAVGDGLEVQASPGPARKGQDARLPLSMLSARFDPGERDSAVELLEDRARLTTLLRGLPPTTEPAEDPLPTWRWALLQNDGVARPLAETGERLPTGARVVIELYNPSAFWMWFVCVILIDPTGRLQLLNARTPEGIQLAPRGRSALGVHYARQGQGIRLDWPRRCLESDNHGPGRVLFLASRSPISLGHIVRACSLSPDTRLISATASTQTKREDAPADGRFAWGLFEFDLHRASDRATSTRRELEACSDHELLQAWLFNNAVAGHILACRHWPTVRGFFVTKVPFDFDDLIVETFMRVKSIGHSYDGSSRFISYLIGIAYNVLREHWRRQATDNRRFELTDMAAVDFDGGGISSYIRERQRSRHLITALRQLKVDDQIVIEMFHFQGLKLKEIAETLDLPLRTAQSRLNTARRRLRDAYVDVHTRPNERALDDEVADSLREVGSSMDEITVVIEKPRD